MGLKEWTSKLFPKEYDVVDPYDEEVYDDDDGGEDRAAVSPVRTVPEAKPAYRPEAPGVAMASRATSLEMKVVSPTKYETVTQIADILLDRKTVLLNLENTNKETAKRLIDFLSGVAYALGGDIQKVADNTFAVTPNNVAVSNEIMDTESAAGEADYE